MSYRSPFLALPPELRLEIYPFVLLSPHPLDLLRPPTLSLPLTSHVIHSEFDFAQAYYTLNTFSLTVTADSLPGLCTRLRAIPSKHLAAIRASPNLLTVRWSSDERGY